jgi:hypothetical protein
MHAHLKKNMFYVYVQWDYDQIVNANARIYDQWASPFCHISYACPSKKKTCPMLCPAGFSLPQIFMLKPIGLQL